MFLSIWWISLFSLSTEHILWILAICWNVGAMAFSSNTSNQLLIVIFVSYFLVGAFLTCFRLYRSTLHRVLGNGQERYSVRLLLIHLCLIFSTVLHLCLTCSEPGLAYNIDVASYVFWMQIPFFVEPNHECLVECLPTCKSESNVPK